MNKKLITVLIMMICLNGMGLGQEVEEIYEHVGGTYSEAFYSSCEGPDGNLYSCGYADTVSDAWDMFVVKTNDEGEAHCVADQALPLPDEQPDHLSPHTSNSGDAGVSTPWELEEGRQMAANRGLPTKRMLTQRKSPHRVNGEGLSYFLRSLP